MRENIIQKLQSDNRGERMAAWIELECELHATHGVLSSEDRRALCDILRAEDDDGVRTQGILCLLSCWACQTTDADPRQEGPRQPNDSTLDGWFLQLFQKSSALISVEQNFNRRDELALAHVARLFPPWINKTTDIQQVPLNGDRWFKLFLERGYETILVMGRLWMFGKLAVRYLRHDDLHFRFCSETRPPNLEQGSLDPSFHGIYEYDGSRKCNEYLTDDDGQTRTDYGLVQVHPVFNGRHWMTAVLCAGCSSLGTLGAATMAYDLGRPYDVNGCQPIPSPPGIGAKSRMEALIKVTADSTGCGWDPSHLEVVRLYVDGRVWSSEKRRWEFAKRPEISVVMKGNRPTGLLFDGEHIRMKTDSQNFRLSAQLARDTKNSPDGTVKIEALTRNKYIWEKNTMTTTLVKKRLHNLNNGPFKGTIRVADEVRLDADVVILQP